MYYDDIDDIEEVEEQLEKRQRINRYRRKRIGKRNLKRLADCAGWAAYYDKDKQRYIRCYTSKRKKQAKKQSNKKVRKSGGLCLNGGGYRRVFDYW